MCDGPKPAIDKFRLARLSELAQISHLGVNLDVLLMEGTNLDSDKSCVTEDDLEDAK